MTELTRAWPLSAGGTKIWGHGSVVASPEVLLETKLQGQDSKSPSSSQPDNDELPCPVPQPMSTSVDAEVVPGVIV